MDEYNWHLLVSRNNFSFLLPGEGELKQFILYEKKICVSKWKGTWYAIANKCPHAGAQLSFGKCDGSGNVVCPNHRFKFNLETGSNKGEGYYVETYPLKEDEKGLFIGFKKKKWWQQIF